MGKQMTAKKGNFMFTIFMWILGILSVYPFLMMILISFRVSGDTYKPLFSVFVPTLENFRTVLGNPHFFEWYGNTFATVAITLVIRLSITLPAAYAFSRLTFKGSGLIFGILLAAVMVPSETTMVPRYLYFKSIGLLDSIWVIILPESAEVFYLLLMTEFFRSIPKDFTEAAKIDGAGHGRILTSVFIPLSGPSIATAVLFSFINIWNNFIDPYLFINSVSHQLITPALKYFQERGGANIPVQLAGASLAIIPIITLFIATQKYFVAGVSSSGIKG